MQQLGRGALIFTKVFGMRKLSVPRLPNFIHWFMIGSAFLTACDGHTCVWIEGQKCCNTVALCYADMR